MQSDFCLHVCSYVLARTCLGRCPVDCWVAGRGGRCLCCGRFSCRSSSSHPPTQPTGPGYLQDRRCKTNVTEFDNTSQMCTHTHTDVYSLKQALFTNIQVFFKTEHFPGIWGLGTHLKAILGKLFPV